jgi:hypothetical protein
MLNLVTLRTTAQLPRRSINDPWGELTRLGFDELCPDI